jgi:ABC-2 family transporter protein
MRCLLWRQHRGQLLWTGLLLAIVGLGSVMVARSADRWFERYDQWVTQMHDADCPVPNNDAEIVPPDGGGLETTPARCESLLSRYPHGRQEAFVSSYNYAIAVFEEGVPLLMVLIGVLVGAPLVAREVEQGTHLVSWTQSIPRRRWYLTKIGVLGAVLLIVGAFAGFFNNRVQIPLTRGGLTSSRWIWFFSIDFAPTAEVALAFALAVTAGAILRRTLPAIGASLIGFLVLFLLTGWAVRSLTPKSRGVGERGTPDDAWVLGGGQYHAASQYWPLQATYLALLLALACGLLAIGWRATRPRSIV